MNRRAARLFRQLRRIPPALLAGAIVLCGVAATLAVWSVARDNAEVAARQRFDAEAAQIASLVQRRMLAHEQILRGGAGLFNVTNRVDRSQWRTYVASLDLEQSHPGILGVGFSLRVPAEQRERHVRTIRAEGFPIYAIRPDTPRDEYNSIIYLEPFTGRNLRAFGYDMATEPTRRKAMERARDTGAAALSGRVTLVQEDKEDVQPGFLLYLPVYRMGLPSASPEERRAALLGYVYSPFRAVDLMRSLLARNFEEDLAIELYSGDMPTTDTLLYASATTAQDHQPRFRAVTRLELGGTVWTLRFASLPGFENSFGQGRNHLILAIGGALTLLVALVVWNLVTVRNLAFATAHEATHELSRSETRLRAVLDSAADGIIGLDPDGRVESANNAVEHIFGVSPADAIGRPAQDLVEGYDLARLDAVLEQYGLSLEAGTSGRFEANGRRAGGELFPIAVSLSRFRVKGSQRYALVVRDITEARLAESMLKLRERAIEASSNGVVIVDMILPGQPVIYANPAFERITGYDADEIVGRNCSLLQGDDREQPAIAELTAAIRDRRPCEVLLRNYRKDGTLFWNELSIAPVADAGGRVTHYVGIQNDITERVAAEINLRIRTKRLDAVFNLSPDGFVGFDANNILTNVNPAFLKMTGYREHDLIGLDANLFDARMRSLCEPGHPCLPTLAAADAAENDEASVTLNLARPQKRVVQRSLRIADLSSGEKVVYFRDITRESEVDRMKSEFLSTAAHDLRTPLASIFGFSELMLNREFDTARRTQMLGTIHRQAGILVNLINELLDLARIEARAGKDFKYRVQPLRAVIEATVSGLLVGNDARQVDVDVPEDLPLVRIDEEKFSQSLTNVLSNAYKYSPRGGNIDLSVLLSESEDSARIGVRVTDRGVGMTSEQVARVFERFFRADPSGNIPGTGLGMCLVKEIMELHGGDVEVASEQGVGTTVTLWLPAASEDDVRMAA